MRYAVLIVVGAFAPLGQATPFVNGSFEHGTFSPNGDNTMSLSAGSTDMAGWTVVGDSLAWIGDPNPFGDLSASDGTKSLDLTDYPVGAPYGGVEQTFDTVAGTMYIVEFDLGSNPLYSDVSGLVVSVDGGSAGFSAFAGNAQRWDRHSFTFTADDSSATLWFLGNAGHAYIGLDNVTVEAVPEPATMAALVTGLVAIARRRRR